jgi:hypothetical protein
MLALQPVAHDGVLREENRIAVAIGRFCGSHSNAAVAAWPIVDNDLLRACECGS